MKKACEHEFYFYPATNEDGWRCPSCQFKPGEPPGFSPELDRSHTRMKVMSLLMDLNNAEIVHVSNGSHGEALESMVAERCKEEGRFDQYSIALFILEAMTASHAKYWKEVSEGILAGKDPRNRCPCGKLSACSTSSANGWLYRCDGCWSADRPADGSPF